MTNTRKYGISYLLYRSLAQYIRTAKLWALLEHSITVLSALSFLTSIIVTEQLFAVITQASQGRTTHQEVVIALGTMAAVTVSKQLLRSLDKYLLGYISYKNVGLFMAELMAKLNRVSAVHFENTHFLDDIDKVKRCIEYETFGYFSSNCLRFFTYYGVFFLSIAVYFFKLSPLLPLIILLSFVPAMLGQFAQINVFMHLDKETAPLRRQFDYYKKAIVSQETFKETRTLGAYHYFKARFQQLLASVTNKTWEVERQVVSVKLLLSLVSFIGLGLSTLLLFHSAIAGEMSIGTFIAVFGGLSQLFSVAEEMVSVYMSKASENIGKIDTYFQLLDMEEMTGENGHADFTKGIHAKNLSFHYPNSHKNALNDITLSLSNGETIAIVGENGAGKSTLVHLLIGLYQPTGGSLEIGGLNAHVTHPMTFFNDISGVFQHFMRYKMTLCDNISISSLSSAQSHNDVQRVLREANFHHEAVTLDTMLSSEYEGIDLSGGQWQRIAIARGLYRPHQLIVLDEPTAAIDPIEEERLFRQFQQLTKDKCAILVTHRLASAQFADRIIVMDNGNIVASGTHDTLMKQQGIYAKMWESQSSWYIRN